MVATYQKHAAAYASWLRDASCYPVSRSCFTSCNESTTPAGGPPVSCKVRKAPGVSARARSPLLIVRCAPQSGRRPRLPRARVLLGRAAASGAGRAASARCAHQPPPPPPWRGPCRDRAVIGTRAGAASRRRGCWAIRRRRRQPALGGAGIAEPVALRQRAQAQAVRVRAVEAACAAGSPAITSRNTLLALKDDSNARQDRGQVA